MYPRYVCTNCHPEEAVRLTKDLLQRRMMPVRLSPGRTGQAAQPPPIQATSTLDGRAPVGRFNHSPLEGESQKPSRSPEPAVPELVERSKGVEGPATVDAVGGVDPERSM